MRIGNWLEGSAVFLAALTACVAPTVISEGGFAHALASRPDAPDAPVQIELPDRVEFRLRGAYTDAHGLPIVVRNSSTRPVYVQWDRSAFVDAEGVTHRIIHEGVTLAERNSREQIASPIPPGARLADSVLAADLVSLVGSGWRAVPWLPGSASQGKTIALHLAIEVDGKIEYATKVATLGAFRVAAPRVIDPYSGLPPPILGAEPTASPKPGDLGYCASDAECMKGQTCANHACRASCSDGACPGAQRCRPWPGGQKLCFEP